MSESNEGSDNLSGFWTGVYDYPNAYGDPVPFNAILMDVKGSLTGEMVEPNTFSSARDRELFASIAGSCEGMIVSFTKQYEGLPKAAHAVTYNGQLDTTYTRIEGAWRTSLRWSGPFIMNRSSGKTEVVELTQTTELEAIR